MSDFILFMLIISPLTFAVIITLIDSFKDKDTDI